MIKITTDDFSIDEVHDALKGEEVGCIVSFVGTVRGISEGQKVQRLEVEVYEEMAVTELEEIRRRAIELFKVQDIDIIHRVGALAVSDNIVLISVSARHRKEAFDACSFVIDELKRLVPIWKKEVTTTESVWIGGRKDERI